MSDGGVCCFLEKKWGFAMYPHIVIQTKCPKIKQNYIITKLGYTLLYAT